MKYSDRAPEMLDNVLYKISSEMKIEVDKVIQQKFTERTGKMRKQLKYIKRRKGVFKLTGSNLANVFERGAEIFPKNGEFLQFQLPDGRWIRTNWVTIPARPFFYPTIRKFVSANRVNLTAEAEINKELKRLKLV